MRTEGVACVITSSIFASASSGDILSSEANFEGCTGERAARHRADDRPSISMRHSDSFSFSQDEERSAVVNELVRGDGCGVLLFELRRRLS